MMSIKIAVPENPVFNELVFRVSELSKTGDVTVFRVPEAQCTELFYSNRVDAAFLSPMAYSNGINTGDFRIVPGPILALSGFTGVASIYFREGINAVESCASPVPDDYMVALGRVLLMERYGLSLKVEKAAGLKEELLKKADSAIVWESNTVNSGALDITEIWTDSFELPLILGFWVCRAEEYPPNINEIIYRLWNNELKPEEQVFEPVEDSGDEFVRDGTIFRQWNADMEYALEKTIHLLYYHQLIAEIAAVKILGRDDKQEQQDVIFS